MEGKEDVVVYTEMVPKSIESCQSTLAKSEVVEQPTPFEITGSSKIAAPQEEVESSTQDEPIRLPDNTALSTYWNVPNYFKKTMRDALDRALLASEAASGLPNTGNVCWLNSLIQCLAHLPPLMLSLIHI
eukprot:TRINITY_DN6365_c0_g1_i2.p1 TRINITY_DN6365_c0_g1~~TRINITY_DN6365_c0_g1_i2.p1  ORF type:complete len:130 (+),score=28.63 TRINITY_DN6365_c0_g1_i2:2-391(+)